MSCSVCSKKEISVQCHKTSYCTHHAFLSEHFDHQNLWKRVNEHLFAIEKSEALSFRQAVMKELEDELNQKELSWNTRSKSGFSVGDDDEDVTSGAVVDVSKSSVTNNAENMVVKKIPLPSDNVFENLLSQNISNIGETPSNLPTTVDNKVSEQSQAGIDEIGNEVKSSLTSLKPKEVNLASSSSRTSAVPDALSVSGTKRSSVYKRMRIEEIPSIILGVDKEERILKALAESLAKGLEKDDLADRLSWVRGNGTISCRKVIDLCKEIVAALNAFFPDPDQVASDEDITEDTAGLPSGQMALVSENDRKRRRALLEITRAKEVGTSSTQSMGLARSDKIRSLVFHLTDTHSFLLREQLIEGSLTPADFVSTSASELMSEHAKKLQAEAMATVESQYHISDLETQLWQKAPDVRCPICHSVGTVSSLVANMERDIRKAEIWGTSSSNDHIKHFKCTCGHRFTQE